MFFHFRFANKPGNGKQSTRETRLTRFLCMLNMKLDYVFFSVSSRWIRWNFVLGQSRWCVRCTRTESESESAAHWQWNALQHVPLFGKSIRLIHCFFSFRGRRSGLRSNPTQACRNINAVTRKAFKKMPIVSNKTNTEIRFSSVTPLVAPTLNTDRNTVVCIRYIESSNLLIFV